MNPLEAVIPLAVGVLLVLRPDVFLKGVPAGEDVTRKRARLRTIGFVLIGVGVLYAGIALVESGARVRP